MCLEPKAVQFCKNFSKFCEMFLELSQNIFFSNLHWVLRCTKKENKWKNQEEEAFSFFMSYVLFQKSTFTTDSKRVKTGAAKLQS